MNVTPNLQTPQRSKVFINYRREDSAANAGRLSDRLKEYFDKSLIFLDLGIPPGVNFVQRINENLQSTKVLLVVIGKSWVTVKDKSGNRRLDNPKDYVRLEIVSALNQGVAVMPILVNGALMPTAEELPEDLKFLAEQNALEISHTRWDYDTMQLIRTLEEDHKIPKKNIGAAGGFETFNQVDNFFGEKPQSLSTPHTESDVQKFFDSLKKSYRERYEQKAGKFFPIAFKARRNWNSQNLQENDENANDEEAVGLITKEFGENGRLLIVGDPGAGKTTLLLKFAIALSEKVGSPKKSLFP